MLTQLAEVSREHARSLLLPLAKRTNSEELLVTFNLFIQRFKLPQRMSVQRQLDKRARNLSTWFITLIHLFFLSSPNNQPSSFLTTLALPYLIMLWALTLITARTAHLQDVSFSWEMFLVCGKIKDDHFPFPSHLLEITHFYDFSNTAHWSLSWWKLCPVLSLFPPYNLPWSKLLYKYQSSHTTFHCLHVLHTLLIFSITFWPEIITGIHNIQHNTPTPFPETKKNPPEQKYFK